MAVRVFGVMASEAGESSQAAVARAAAAVTEDPAVVAASGDETAAGAAVEGATGPSAAAGASGASQTDKQAEASGPGQDVAAGAVLGVAWTCAVSMSDMVQGLRKKNKIPTPASLMYKDSACCAAMRRNNGMSLQCTMRGCSMSMMEKVEGKKVEGRPSTVHLFCTL